MTRADTEPVYARLLAERVTSVEGQRAALVAAIESTRVARSLMFADDEHDPDGSTASLDQARDTALLERAEQTLAALAAAQQRLSSGSYGICEVCGREIAAERLIARPETRDCIDCAAKRGRGRR
ncbi:MAG: TraR/DksA C4-type zinc finger protein [Microlunatus sp.]